MQTEQTPKVNQKVENNQEFKATPTSVVQPPTNETKIENKIE